MLSGFYQDVFEVDIKITSKQEYLQNYVALANRQNGRRGHVFFGYAFFVIGSFGKRPRDPFGGSKISKDPSNEL